MDMRKNQKVSSTAIGIFPFLMISLSFAGCAPSASSTLGLGITDDDGSTLSGDENGASPYCETVVDWPEEWESFENQVLALVNDRRAAGATCSGREYGPAGPLAMNGALRCAAQNHSLDMGQRDYFDHYSPEGDGPGERFEEAGYAGSTWGENIAWGYGSPEAVVEGWMNSPGHCANLMNPNFTETGVGFYEGSLWTQTFGRP